MDKPVALGEVTLGEGVDSWNTIIFLYNSALKEVRTKVEILNDEFQQVHQYNPIEYIKSRIKAPESIVKKLKRYGYDSSIDNMVNYINDIAGIRIVCSFTSDIYRLAEMIGKQNDLTVISVKDYIRHPKESGYKSYHMLVTVPIFLSDCIIDTKVEIQIRTMAMDFWATIEHSLQYKYKANIPDHIRERLSAAAKAIIVLDNEMSSVRSEIMDAQNSSQIQRNLITDILNNIENLYKVTNKREVEKIQDEFYHIYAQNDLQELKRFHKELDLIAEGYRAQAITDEL